jgi:hypothetical protein
MSEDGLQMNYAYIRRPQPDIWDNTGSKQQIVTKSHYKGKTSPTQQAFKNETHNEEEEGARHSKHSEYTNK